MRTISEEPVQTPTRPTELDTYSAQLRDGRTITVREMTGKDLVYMEEDLAGMSDIRKNFMLMAHLNVGNTKLSYEDVENLSVSDIKTITELVAKANGTEEDSKN